MDPTVLAALITVSGGITAVNLGQFSRTKKPEKERPQMHVHPYTGRKEFPSEEEFKRFDRRYMKQITGYYATFLTPAIIFAIGIMSIVLNDFDYGTALLAFSIVLNMVSIACQKKWFS